LRGRRRRLGRLTRWLLLLQWTLRVVAVAAAPRGVEPLYDAVAARAELGWRRRGERGVDEVPHVSASEGGERSPEATINVHQPAGDRRT
jgi:hypothetical protein